MLQLLLVQAYKRIMYNGCREINHRCGICLPVPISRSSQGYNLLVQITYDMLSFREHRERSDNFYSGMLRVEDWTDCLIHSRVADNCFSEVILLFRSRCLAHVSSWFLHSMGWGCVTIKD